MAKGYAESQLVSNRSGVLIWGGTDEDRRAWAQEAATQLGAPLRIVESAGEIAGAMRSPESVVFFPAATVLPDPEQLALVRCLREQEERPKVVVGVTRASDRAKLRPDLDYALSLGQLDLDAPGVKDAIKARRKQAASKASAKKKR